MKSISPTMYAARLAESHPMLWWAAWQVAHLSMLLPHDKSYLALRRFIRSKPNALILDIGANDGISALGFRKLAPDAQILAIEPNPIHEAALARIGAKDRNFRYKIAACGASSGRISLCMPWYRNIPLHTFCSSSTENALEQIRISFGAGVARQVKVTEFGAEVVTIDDLDVSPGIVKVDAEGASLLVLQGALRTLEKARPVVVVEVGEEDADVVGLLTSNGYEMATYDVPTDSFGFGMHSTAHAPGQRNSFAIPREMAREMRTLT